MLPSLRFVSQRLYPRSEPGCLHYRSQDCAKRVQQLFLQRATLSDGLPSRPTKISEDKQDLLESKIEEDLRRQMESNMLSLSKDKRDLLHKLRELRDLRRRMENMFSLSKDTPYLRRERELTLSKHKRNLVRILGGSIPGPKVAKTSDAQDGYQGSLDSSTHRDNDSPSYSLENERATETTVEPEIWQILEQRLSDVETVMQGSDGVTPSPKDTLAMLFYPQRQQIDRLRCALNYMLSRSPHEDNSDTPGELSALRLLSDAEWRQLSKACLNLGDVDLAETVLGLMRLAGLSPSNEQCDAVLGLFAARGMVKAADAHVSGLPFELLRENQRDLLVKARVHTQDLHQARELLYLFEKLNVPAPVRSYTFLIRMLFKQPETSEGDNTKEAFRLFKHMRKFLMPDASLYNLMIHSVSRPEFCLSLFAEMIAQGIVPTAPLYDVVIKQCISKLALTGHAFRLAREMLDAHRNRPEDFPTPLMLSPSTFRALISAAKFRDLPMTRWLFDKIVHAHSEQNLAQPSGYINASTLSHLFLTYARFFPGPKQSIQEVSSETPSVLPQSSEEVIHEVTLLWERIVRPTPVFRHVVLTPNLLNAYLAVHYAHSLPSRSYKVNADLFEPLGVMRDAFSRMIALEAYAHPEKSISRDERLVALAFGREIWKDWLLHEDTDSDKLYDCRTRPRPRLRKVERAWGAMIRLLTLVGKLEEAEELLHLFVWRYPPPTIGDILEAGSTDSTEKVPRRPKIPDDHVVPFFELRDIELLLLHAIETKRERTVRSIQFILQQRGRG